jgi:hypothetical protein
MKFFYLRTLERFRRFLLSCHGYPSTGVISAGIPCNVEDPTKDITYGDVVHPCVRYIEEAFEEHQWWMVYTPFYAENDKLENPRLCYADATEGETPTEWKFYCSIANTPETGYNSDPTLLFEDGCLFVFWREYQTPKAKSKGFTGLTVGCRIQDKHITFLSKPLLTEQLKYADKEVSSTFMSNNGVFKAYAIHADFVPNYVFRVPSYIGCKLYDFKIVFLLDAFGIANINKSHGVAIWDSDSIEQTFDYRKTVQFENSSNLYQPWHMEVFRDCVNEDKALYAVVLSRQRHGRICLAKSMDGETFRIFDKPLLTSKNTESIGLYKPSAVIVGNKFYLFYTIHDNKDYNLHRLFVTSIDWKDLLRKIDNP